jgi:hypothetical protein
VIIVSLLSTELTGTFWLGDTTGVQAVILIGDYLSLSPGTDGDHCCRSILGDLRDREIHFGGNPVYQELRK